MWAARAIPAFDIARFSNPRRLTVPLTLYGIILIVFGILYIKKQNIYRRGIWLKTSIAIRLLSEENYKKYIKGLGVVFVIVGACLIVWEQAHRLGVFHG